MVAAVVDIFARVVAAVNIIHYSLSNPAMCTLRRVSMVNVFHGPASFRNLEDCCSCLIIVEREEKRGGASAPTREANLNCHRHIRRIILPSSVFRTRHLPTVPRRL